MSDASRLAESIEKTIDKKVKSALSGGPKTVTAHVHGVDGEGVVWVILPGSSQAIPVKRSTVEVSEGDTVTVEVGNGRACITGSTTAPAISAKRAAELMVPIAEATHEAQRGAEDAMSMAKVAKEGADTAARQAESATASAQEAQRQADAATESAGRAAEAAGAAQESADAAADAADVADGKAEEAIASAGTAKEAADSALVQLATVEDVVGTATWIAEHGTYEPTEDAAVDDSKVYYERTGSGTQADPWVYTAVAEPTDEGLAGYYELHVEQAVSQYVASHLALTDAGLYVLKDASGYKLLLANTGMSIIDPDGHVAVTYGSTISFDSTRAFSIGNEDAYVLFTPASGSTPASLVIGGANVQLGSSRTLAEWEADMAQAVEDAAAALDSATLVITSTNGNLFKNGAESTVLQVAVFPNGGGRLDTIAGVRERFGAGAYVEWRWKHDADGTWGTL
ncbi:MAG: hypothetical protein IKE55_04540, partial [Kiritimatiellae bacterium]|nr:hypothetical protein [Kiritimatiellia bacterium]